MPVKEKNEMYEEVVTYGSETRALCMSEEAASICFRSN